MSLELEDYELSLQKTYGSETSFKHSDTIQSIINHVGFSLTEITKVWKGHLMVGWRSGFLTTSASFQGSIATAECIIEASDKKLKFVLCEDTRSLPSSTNVIVFPAHREIEYRNILQRLDKLKAFI